MRTFSPTDRPRQYRDRPPRPKPQKKVRQAPPKPKKCYVASANGLGMQYRVLSDSNEISILVNDNPNNPSETVPTFPSHKAAHTAVFDTMAYRKRMGLPYTQSDFKIVDLP